MVIGSPKEIKNNEARIGLNTSSVSALVRAGHEVLIEQGAGVGSGYSDSAYQKAGAPYSQTHSPSMQKQK